jgi:hypothetical protein
VRPCAIFCGGTRLTASHAGHRIIS